MNLWKNRGGLVDHCDPDADADERRCDFHPDKARANDHRAGTGSRRNPLAKRERISERTEFEYSVEPSARHIELPRPRPGRDQQLAILINNTGMIRNTMIGGVHIACGGPQAQGNLICSIALRGQQRDLIRSELARDDVLGEQRAIVRRDWLRSEQNDTALCAFIAQRLRCRHCGDSASN